MNDNWIVTIVGVICIALASISSFYMGMNEGEKRAYTNFSTVNATFPINTNELISGGYISGNWTNVYSSNGSISVWISENGTLMYKGATNVKLEE